MTDLTERIAALPEGEYPATRIYDSARNGWIVGRVAIVEQSVADAAIAELLAKLGERERMLSAERAQFVKGRDCYSPGSYGWDSWQNAIRELDQARTRAAAPEPEEDTNV